MTSNLLIWSAPNKREKGRTQRNELILTHTHNFDIFFFFIVPLCIRSEIGHFFILEPGRNYFRIENI